MARLRLTLRARVRRRVRPGGRSVCPQLAPYWAKTASTRRRRHLQLVAPHRDTTRLLEARLGLGLGLGLGLALGLGLGRLQLVPPYGDKPYYTYCSRCLQLVPPHGELGDDLVGEAEGDTRLRHVCGCRLSELRLQAPWRTAPSHTVTGGPPPASCKPWVWPLLSRSILNNLLSYLRHVSEPAEGAALSRGSTAEGAEEGAAPRGE
eukprot:scaffold79990_cov70-Phaeocystis_antarctica.AAC.4